MGSLFKKTIDKKEAINMLKKTFANENYFIKYDDPRLIILNNNYDSEITDIKIEESKNGLLFLIIIWNKKNDTKENKYCFKLFKNNIKEKLDFIFSCELKEFEKTKQENNNKEEDNGE